MGRFVGLGVWWLVLGVATVIVERFIEGVPTEALITVAVVGALIAWPMMLLGGGKKRAPKKAQKYADFDMPILSAIEHMVQTVAHSWDSPDKAERAFFRSIHTQMRAGRLRVVGAEVPDGPLRRIGKRKIAKLTPVPMNVPQSDTTPHGVSFVLIDEAKLPEPEKHRGPLPGFFDLRVRSKDLYRLWPRTRAQNGGEE